MANSEFAPESSGSIKRIAAGRHPCTGLRRAWEASLTFSPEALPRTTQVAAATLKQLQEVARRFAEAAKAREDAEQQRRVSEPERTRLEAEIKQLQAEIAAVK